MSQARRILSALTFLATGSFAQHAAPQTLDFEYFRANVQPIFLTKRDGNSRCVSCHSIRPQMHMEPLPDGAATWGEAASRANFGVASAYVVPGDPHASKLLLHPLAEEAGGDPHHDGGKHWRSKDDPEWQRLAAWVEGATLDEPMARKVALEPRIIQTNSAGDNVHIIDPRTNRVVGEITGIEVGHGAAAAPDGSRLYVSNEAESTLDVVDGYTLRIMTQIPLTGHPNNISASPDGRRVYVAIRQLPGAVDIIDTASLTVAKSIPIDGTVHNTYVTPDGRYVVAGSIDGKNATVIDAATEEIAWSKYFDLGVRPMAFESNADGTTKRLFVQLSGFNGFAVVDFATREETARIELPKLAPGKEPVLTGGNESHGMAVTPDNSVLVVDSRLNSAVYMYSLPGLELLGSVDVGTSPDWVTLTPDGRTAYVANAGSNDVSVVDIRGLKELTRIPVGQVPKRNITAMMAP
jgi:YVTN family beta-propeller protein